MQKTSNVLWTVPLRSPQHTSLCAAAHQFSGRPKSETEEIWRIGSEKSYHEKGNLGRIWVLLLFQQAIFQYTNIRKLVGTWSEELTRHWISLRKVADTWKFKTKQNKPPKYSSWDNFFQLTKREIRFPNGSPTWAMLAVFYVSVHMYTPSRLRSLSEKVILVLRKQIKLRHFLLSLTRYS